MASPDIVLEDLTWQELDAFCNTCVERTQTCSLYGGSLQYESTKDYHRLWGQMNEHGRRYCFVAIHRPTHDIYQPDRATGQVDRKRQKAKGNLRDEWRGTKYVTPSGVYNESVAAYRRWVLNPANPLLTQCTDSTH